MNKQQQCISQCCIVCPNEPSAIAKMTQMLAKEGITPDCMLTECFGSLCCVRFLCEKEMPSLRKKLEACGFQMVEDQVFCFEMPKGDMSKLTKMLCEEKILVRYMYSMTCGNDTTRMVLCVDQPEQAARIVKDCCAEMAGSEA